ncbi:MAG: hypothetical protein AAF213_07795, partial [Pseudomonadota bacterium]
RARGGVGELLTFDDMYQQNTTKADKQAQFPGVTSQITDASPLWAKRPTKGDKVREVDAFPHQDTLNFRQSIEFLVGSPDDPADQTDRYEPPVFACFPIDMAVDDDPHTISLRENIQITVKDFDEVAVFDPTGQKKAALYTPEQALAASPSPDIKRLADEQIVVKRVDAEAVAAGPAPGSTAAPDSPRQRRAL